MPSVPRYERQVQETGTPKASLSVDAPLEMFGGGAPGNKLEQANQRVSGELLKMADQEKQKADRMNVRAGSKTLSDWITQTTYNPKTGFLNKRGEDAFDLPNTVMAEYAKTSEEVLKTMHNEAQRNSFKEEIRSHWIDLDRSVQAHVAGERRTYDKSLITSYVANEQEASALAYNDPQRIGMAIQRQQKAIIQYADDNGLPTEERDRLVHEAVGKTHEAVIYRMLANDEDAKAKGWYDAIKGEYGSKEIDKALEEGTLRGESQRNVDAMMAKGLDRAGAYAEAKKIDDPKLREATETRIDTIFDRKKEAEYEALNQLYLAASAITEKNIGQSARFVVPPDMWAKLTVEQRNSLERRSEETPHNSKVWLDFIDMTPDQMAAVNRSDFEAKYWTNFDKEHRTRAESMLNQAIDAKGKGPADPKLSTTLTFNNRVEDTLRAADMIPKNKLRNKLTKSQSDLYDRFETEAARQIENYELTTLGGKRKASGEEMQKIIDEMAIKKVFVEKSWGTDPEKPVGVMTTDERSRAYVPYDTIPPEEIKAIENISKSKGRKMTRSKAERAYAASMMRDRRLFDAIIAE